MRARCQNRARGFSLLELLLVLAIMFVATAVAVPYMLSNMELLRLRSKAMELNELLQRARSIAAKTNSPVGVGLTGSTFALLGNTQDANQGKLVLPGNMSAPATGIPALLTAGAMGISASATITAAGADTPAYFNARGLPCPYSNSAKTCNSATSAQAYVYYLRDTAYLGSKGWAAVSVTPSGRTRVWTWNGTAWK